MRYYRDDHKPDPKPKPEQKEKEKEVQASTSTSTSTDSYDFTPFLPATKDTGHKPGYYFAMVSKQSVLVVVPRKETNKC